MQATPKNPILFRFVGKIPSLKNNKQAVSIPGKRYGKLVMAPQVRRWIIDNHSSLYDQWLEQQKEYELERILLPDRIVIHFDWHVYAAKEISVPSADLDGAGSTVQEVFQSPKVWKMKVRRQEMALDVYEDDRQIINSMHTQVLIPQRSMEGGVVAFWPTDREATLFDFLDQHRDYVENNTNLYAERFFNSEELPVLLQES